MNGLKIFSLILFIAICNIVESQNTVRGIPVFTKTSKATGKCKGNNVLQCTAACDSLMVCNGDDTDPILTQKCQDSTPFCEPSGNSATCQSTPGDTCLAPEAKFTCTSEGYFPDLTSCTQHYLCAGPNNLVGEFTCPAGYVYSSSDVTCKRGIPCVRVTCPTTGPVMLPYSANPNFYYICQPLQKPKVYKCDHEFMRFVVGVGCQFTCPAEGVYQKDEKSYYFCYRDGVTITFTVVNCPNNYVFDKESKRCKLSESAITSPAPTTTVAPSSSSSTTSTMVTPEGGQ